MSSLVPVRRNITRNIPKCDDSSDDTDLSCNSSFNYWTASLVKVGKDIGKGPSALMAPIHIKEIMRSGLRRGVLTETSIVPLTA